MARWHAACLLTPCAGSRFGRGLLCAGATITSNVDPGFPFGRLTQSWLGERIAEYTNYDGNTQENGIVQSYGAVRYVDSPTPGTVDGEGAHGNTVRTTYTYTALGNVATVKVPAPNDSGGSVTYTFDYHNDPLRGIQGAPEALGEPLTVTSPLGFVWHYWYESRCNIPGTNDERGNAQNGVSPYETDLAYDDADDLICITYPPAVTSGNGRACTH
jgi:hypothetical protein